MFYIFSDYRVIYAGVPTCQRGVAVIAEARVAERVTEIDRFRDRIMVVKVKADPMDIAIVQAYCRQLTMKTRMSKSYMIS